jgi:lysophospholipase L1-like esterase
MKIEKGQRLLFTGDSITSAARNFDMNGEGSDDAFGSGYVRMVKSIIESGYPERNIRFINTGYGGNTIRDLAGRWQADVVDREPDWLSVKIGINDVWRQFDAPLRSELHVVPEEYQATYRRLLAPLRAKLKGLVLCSPYVIDDDPKDAMRARMDEYRAMCQELAREFDAIYVDTQAPFDAYLKYHHPNALCWDRIHPSATGHMLIARAWLDAVGFDWQA